MPEKNAVATLYCEVYPRKRKLVKTRARRFEQDKAREAFRRGAYIDVRNPRKTQSQRRIAKYIRARYTAKTCFPITVIVGLLKIQELVATAGL